MAGRTDLGGVGGGEWRKRGGVFNGQGTGADCNGGVGKMARKLWDVWMERIENAMAVFLGPKNKAPCSRLAHGGKMARKLWDVWMERIENAMAVFLGPKNKAPCSRLAHGSMTCGPTEAGPRFGPTVSFSCRCDEIAVNAGR
jgi:hypothetical protein